MTYAPPDLALFLTHYLRTNLDNIEVGINEPPDLTYPITRPLIVVRADGGPQRSYVTYSHAVGVSILAGTRRNPAPAITLARHTYGLLAETRIALADGSPIAAVDLGGFNGPYQVAETHDVTRMYLTAAYTVVTEKI